MFSSLMISTIHAPLLLGLALAAFCLLWPKRAWDLALAVGLLLAAYILLEGLPALPPVASKQKLAYLLALAGILVAVAPRLRLALPVMTALFLLAATIWLGWPKLVQTGVLALAPALVPIISATVGSLSLPKAEQEPFLWPLALLIFAAGGAILSLLGVFVGFAQVSGAFAAFAGGTLLALYTAKLLGRGVSLSVPVAAFLLLALSSVVILIGLFAPEINVVALAILSVTLVMPAIVPGFTAFPAALRPIAQGLVSSIPAACALALAYLQS